MRADGAHRDQEPHEPDYQNGARCTQALDPPLEPIERRAHGLADGGDRHGHQDRAHEGTPAVY
jgi:hypothetical protein